MAEAFFRAKVADKTYELPRLTLGDAMVLRKHFALTDMSEFNPADPMHLAGCLFLCIRREHPKATHEVLMAELEAIDIADFKPAEDEPDPTPAAEDAAAEDAPAAE